MISTDRLNLIYDNFIREYQPGHVYKLMPEYIRYLCRVDAKLWSATALENEYGLKFQQIANILRPLKNKLPVDRRCGDRRKK